MSFVMDFVSNSENKFYLQIFGSLMLLVFGIYCFKSDPMKNMHKSSNKQGTLMHNGITAFHGIVIINKVIGSVVIIFSIIALFGTIFNLYHLPEF
ncbi:Uncharacterised protein [Segatella copri]|nr:Uncharacterised protein [Segatella copri]